MIKFGDLNKSPAATKQRERVALHRAMQTWAPVQVRVGGKDKQLTAPGLLGRLELALRRLQT